MSRSSWAETVKAMGIDRMRPKDRGFICGVLFRAIHHDKTRGTLTGLLEEQEAAK